jgi:glucose-6-phosphate 1-dehydrogenase
MNDYKPEPVVLVIFGAGGDLAWRKLVPALYSLYVDHWLPEQFAVIGVDRRDLDDRAFGERLRDGVDRFSRQGVTDEEAWASFASRFHYLSGSFDEEKTFTVLGQRLADYNDSWQQAPDQIFYLAIPPFLFAKVTENLGAAGLTGDREHTRIVIEKPIGHDLRTAQELNDTLTKAFDESQIYRIDHYLGKETVQNILAFRFANALFEPIWDRRYIEQIQITVAESVGVEHRGDYYEGAGALRDMIQNHLLQILCLVAMEPPVTFAADEIRDKKVEVLRAVRPIPKDRVGEFAARGQYTAGTIDGESVPAYRDEPDVASDSTTETFAALKLTVDNWRWQDVPFYLRTGKRLPDKISTVTVCFRPVPHRSFPASATENWQSNQITIHIQPDEGIDFGFQAKQPGPTLRLDGVNMVFRYRTAFQDRPLPEAYETLLLDVMRGDATLFMRADQVAAAWRIVMPVLEAWQADTEDLAFYPAGSWGPETATTLIEQDGRHWFRPSEDQGRSVEHKQG